MLKRFLITFCIAATIVILFSALVTQKRDKRRTLEGKQNQLVEKIANLEKKNSKLKNEYNALKNDPFQIEKEARETYGYTKQGEITYNKHKFALREPKSNKIEKINILNKMNTFLFEGPFPWQVPLGIIAVAAIFLIFSYRHESKRLHR